MRGKPKNRAVPQKPLLNEKKAKSIKRLLAMMPATYAIHHDTRDAVRFLYELSEWRLSDLVIKDREEKCARIRDCKARKSTITATRKQD
jgi:hypothetical protein